MQLSPCRNFLVLANIKTKALYVVHIAAEWDGGGIAAAALDRLAEFGLSYPILSFIVSDGSGRNGQWTMPAAADTAPAFNLSRAL